METEKKIHRSPLARLALRTALARTAVISVVSAVIIFGALTVQMALGNDPALGPKAKSVSIASTNNATGSGSSEAGDDESSSPVVSVLRSAVDEESAQTQSAPVQTQVPAAPVAAPTPTPVSTSTS